MDFEGWYYYNHAAMVAGAPHNEPNLAPIKDGRIWKELTGKPLFAVWTTNFDQIEKGEWYYVIKDEPFDINVLKSKRRYEIKKGEKNFDVKIIDIESYKDDLYNVVIKSYEERGKNNRLYKTKDEFFIDLASWKNNIFYAAFDKENGSLCGYAMISVGQDYIFFSTLNVIPSAEKRGVNAAIVYKLLQDNRESLLKGLYICDGARNVSHKTNFQDYLEKYFGFRKAYCVLNIAYCKKMKVIVSILYPFRKIFEKLKKNSLFSKIYSVLKLEEIARSYKRENTKR